MIFDSIPLYDLSEAKLSVRNARRPDVSLTAHWHVIIRKNIATAVLHQPAALSHSLKFIETSCNWWAQSQASAQHEMYMLDCSCCTDDRYQSYTYGTCL